VTTVFGAPAVAHPPNVYPVRARAGVPIFPDNVRADVPVVQVWFEGTEPVAVPVLLNVIV
jgi:hypothetical protein